MRSTRVPLAALSPQSWRVLLGLAAWHRRYLSCLRGLFCFANPKWPAQTKVKPLHMFAAAWSVCLASGPKECGFAFFAFGGNRSTSFDSKARAQSEHTTVLFLGENAKIHNARVTPPTTLASWCFAPRHMDAGAKHPKIHNVKTPKSG